jgi:tetratricopeptide (TPR) repeat protein
MSVPRSISIAILLLASLAMPMLHAQTATDSAAAERAFRAAVSHYQTGQYSVAARELQELERRIPPNFQVEELLGLVLSAERKDLAASRAFAEAVRLQPHSAAAHANFAVNLDRLGRRAQAEAEFKKALNAAPNDYEANQDLGEFYVRAGKFAKALPYLAKAQRIHPSHGGGYDLALAEEKAGQLQQARLQIQRLLVQTKTAELYNLAADIDEKSGNYVVAAREYQQAAYMNPSEQNIFDWGSEFLIHHTWNAAIQVFSGGVNRYPDSAALTIGLGLAYYWHGDYGPAVKALMRASDLNPSDPQPYYFLSHAYLRSQGQAGEVSARFRRFENLQPHNPHAAYYYAMTLLKSNGMASSGPALNEAESLLRKAVRIDPSYARAYLLLGNLYFQEHQYAKAVPEYQQALRLQPTLPEAHYHLGQAYMQLGDKSLAQKEFELHQKLYARHLAEDDRERGQILKFVYSERAGERTVGSTQQRQSPNTRD